MPALPRPGDRLAGFRIERELGHGTTGVVYLAHQDALDRRVALKVVGWPLADDAAFRERFRREARAIAGLDHPNVVQVLEAGEDDAHLWLAMRLVDGPDLRVLLRRTGRLDPEQAVAVVEQVAAALDAAHAAGLVHRDVKPSNVLIEDGPGRDLHVELADFGLARAPGTDAAEGTPGYAAPEQLGGGEAGPAADVFGLGCVLYELLTGSAPPPREADGPGRAWRGPDGVPGSPLRPSVALPSLGGAFDPAVERATHPDPAARFASAGDLALWARAALDVPRAEAVVPVVDPVRVAAATPASPAEVGPSDPTWENAAAAPRRRRGRRLLLAAFLVLVLAALAVAFVRIGDLGRASRDDVRAGGAPTPAGGTGTGTGTGSSGATGGGGTSGTRAPGGTSAGGGSSTGGGAGAAGGSSAGRSSSGAAGARAGAGGSAAASGTSSGSGRPGSGSSSSGDRAGGSSSSGDGAAGGPSSRDRAVGGSSSAGGAAGGSSSAGGAARGSSSSGGGGSSAGSSSAVPQAGPGAPTGATAAALPPVAPGRVRFGGGGWVLDLPTAEGWRQTAVQERDGGARILTRLTRPDAVRLVIEALPGRTAVVGVPGARTFPVRLPDAGRTDGALYRGGRFAMCADGVCSAVAANGPNGGVLLVAGAHRAAGAKRVARRAASGLRVR